MALLSGCVLSEPLPLVGCEKKVFFWPSVNFKLTLIPGIVFTPTEKKTPGFLALSFGENPFHEFFIIRSDWSVGERERWLGICGRCSPMSKICFQAPLSRQIIPRCVCLIFNQ